MATLKVNTVSGIGTEGTVFDGGLKFRSENYMTLPKGDTTQRGRGRAVFMGGYVPGTYTRSIDYIEIQSTGNAVDFGDTGSTSVGEGAACASSTRGVQGGGSLVNTMEFITIAVPSNTTNFGDLTVARRSLTALSSETRGIWAGGTTNPAMSDVIDFATIATTGDAADFGDLTVQKRNAGKGQASNATRHIVYGGQITPTVTNSIEFASSGEITSFGTLSTAASGGVGVSNGHGGL